jgi:electron transport complex protein RnfE
MAVSMAKSIIPDKVRIPAYIVIIATFVTLLEMIMKAYVPALYESLGIFIPLIVVNCIVLARAEAYASKHSVIESGLDGLGIGLGFTTALTMLGSVRELLGTGKIFGLTVYPSSYGALIFILAPGAFIVLGYLIALFNRFITKKA